LFIDDSVRNCVTARSLGLDAIRFESPELLREALKQRGVVV
jgi:FMN phosphatase YigB (HAD superfamily)